MTNLGDTLRQERESRGVSLEEVAGAIKIAQPILEALEQNDFLSLPGGPFNKGFVRAYARYIGLDPEATVKAYARAEKASGLRSPDADRELERERSRLIELRSEGDRNILVLDWSALQRALLVVVFLGVVSAGLWISFRSGDAAAEAGTTSPTLPARAPGPDTGIGPSAEAPAASSRSRLSVRESGLGTAVVNRRLIGRRARFEEGTQVWFWTRSVGGTAGEEIRHVWLREGRPAATYELTVGGPHWRNSTRKTLLPGSAGDWSVEARDAAGRVLARQAFVCIRPR